MIIINLFSKTVLSSTLLMMSGVVLADGVIHTGTVQKSVIDQSHLSSHQQSSSGHYSEGDVPQMVASLKMMSDNEVQIQDHGKEHGRQIYATTIVDNQWAIDDAGKGQLSSSLEMRIGTDENKAFIKSEYEKTESELVRWDTKLLYSRLISGFWDAQAGVRYRTKKIDIDDMTITDKKWDAVVGLHGLAPYFFETDAYFYVGENSYVGFSLETEHDVLLTQKLIVKPYLDLDIVFNDDARYAEKTGLNNAKLGFETRYEVTKKVMPYLDIGYEYRKGLKGLIDSAESETEKGMLYGAGIRFMF